MRLRAPVCAHDGSAGDKPPRPPSARPLYCAFMIYSFHDWGYKITWPCVCEAAIIPGIIIINPCENKRCARSFLKDDVRNKYIVDRPRCGLAINLVYS